MSQRGDRSRLRKIAHRAMQDRDMLPEYSRDVDREIHRLKDGDGREEDPVAAQRRDQRALLWASIDNDDSRDIDQLSVAEALDDGTIKVLIAVADVDFMVAKASAVDGHAKHNTTSVYTAGGIFAMLPEALSYDLTSLNEGEDRAAMVVEMIVDEAEGTVEESSVYPAIVRNRAKMAYDSVAAWLEGVGEAPAPLGRVDGLADNVRLQDRAAQALRRKRYERGALDLQTLQTRAVFDGDDITGMAVDEGNRAKELIEDFMIAANGVTARFLRDHGVPSLRRIVREPRRWDRIVDVAAEHEVRLPQNPSSGALSEFLAGQREVDPVRFPDLSVTIVKLIGAGEYIVEFPGEKPTGHFGLAVRDYVHSTAPNRRFPDLITQRLLKSVLAGVDPAYDSRDLAHLAEHCTEKEDDADKVERRVNKSAAALLLEDRVGATFDAIVTGASAKGTWVRIFDPHCEGRLTDGFDSVDVGDAVMVRLASVDVERGWIDFEKMRG